MLKTPNEHKEERIWFRAEPSLIARSDRVAALRFGGNRSLLIRLAIERLVTELEDELGIGREEQAA